MATIASFKSSASIYTLTYRDFRYYFSRESKDVFSPNDTSKLMEASAGIKRVYDLFVNAANNALLNEVCRDTPAEIRGQINKAKNYAVCNGLLTKEQVAIDTK
jgi:hypothetical protein